MNPEIYLSIAQTADLLGFSQETIYKEIQSGNLNAIESTDQKRRHKVIALSELSRLYGNIYIPEGYLEYAGNKSVDFVRVALRQENQRLRNGLEEIQKRQQNLKEQLNVALQVQKTLMDANADLAKTIDNLTTVLGNMA